MWNKKTKQKNASPWQHFLLKNLINSHYININWKSGRVYTKKEETELSKWLLWARWPFYSFPCLALASSAIPTTHAADPVYLTEVCAIRDGPRWGHNPLGPIFILYIYIYIVIIYFIYVIGPLQNFRHSFS